MPRIVSTISYNKLFDPSADENVGKPYPCNICLKFKLYKNLPNIEDIFNGKNPPIPTKVDELYALVSSMVSYASKHKDDLMKIAASIRYSDKFPPDFSVILIKDYLALEKDYKFKLMKLPEFMNFVKTKGRFLNGLI